MASLESNNHHARVDRGAAEAAKRKESIQRSMSRYRNRPARVNTATAAAPPVPEMPRSPDIRHAYTSPAPATSRVDNPFEDPRFEERPVPREERKHRKKIQKEKPGFFSRLLGSKETNKDEKVKTKFGTANYSGESRGSSSHSQFGTPSSNSGKKVRVTCGNHVTELAVHAETKARDVVVFAAQTLDIAIDPDQWTITEFFRPLHLERPLRRYESVRAVVGSWDNDSQNHLVMSRRDEENDLESDDFVEARFAPHKQPAEVSFHLYHASRNGKWEKRYITVRPDGQVTLSKKMKPLTTADSVNICHMSDFDIFSLTRREQKRVRPPKKFSFAVKSMQKSNMFEKNNNFVHYFSTKDQNMAMDFYHAIHGWRSYYIVHVLCAAPGSRNGNNGLSDAGSAVPAITHTRSRKNTVSSTYQARLSAESYRGGHPPAPAEPASYNDYDEPVLERAVTRGSNAPLSVSVSRTNTLHRHKTLSRPASPTKPYSSSYPHNHTTLSRPASREASSSRPTSRRRATTTSNSTPTPDDPFAPTGLLGRTYTQKQQAMQARKTPNPNPESDPFAPNTLLSEIDRRKSQSRSTRRARSNTLRRPGTTTSSATATASASNRPSFENAGPNTVDAISPFTPGGLLAGLSRAESQSRAGLGRSGTMVEFRGGGSQSQFAEGSLLRDVEERERGYGGY